VQLLCGCGLGLMGGDEWKGDSHEQRGNRSKEF
jgi:hypothetical protein